MAEYAFAILSILKPTYIPTRRKAYDEIMSDIGSTTPKDSTLMQKKKKLIHDHFHNSIG